MKIISQGKCSEDGRQDADACGLWRSGLLAVAAVALVACLLLGQQLGFCAQPAEDPEPAALPGTSDRAPATEQPAADAAESSPACEWEASCTPCCRRAASFRVFRRLESPPTRGRCCGRGRCLPYPGGAAHKPDPYAWKDLFDGKTLDGWKVPKFGGEGEVHVKDGAVVLEMGDLMTGITYTGKVPREDFELSLEGARLDGHDFFCTTTFPVGKDPCTLVVGGWGGTVVGLSNVDFYDASDNLTTTFHDFKKGQWFKVRIRVTAAKIEAWIDDRQVVDQEREGHKFGIRWEVDLCQPLGIATWMTKGAVRNIRLRELRPEETKAPPAKQD